MASRHEESSSGGGGGGGALVNFLFGNINSDMQLDDDDHAADYLDSEARSKLAYLANEQTLQNRVSDTFTPLDLCPIGDSTDSTGKRSEIYLENCANRALLLNV